MIKWQSETRKLKDLKDYDRNPRNISEKAFKNLIKSLKEDGYHQRIIVNTDGTIIGGHQRKQAMLKAGFKQNDDIEVLVPDRKLDEREFDRLNIRDNLPFGEFNFEILANNFEIDTLTEWGMPEEWLSIPDLGKDEKIKESKKTQEFSVKIYCEDESDQDAVIKMMQAKGYKCEKSENDNDS